MRSQLHVDKWQHSSLLADVKFEWDAAKEAANIAKHGVNFSEAQLAFSDPPPRYFNR
jgi:hypothetical protein